MRKRRKIDVGGLILFESSLEQCGGTYFMSNLKVVLEFVLFDNFFRIKVTHLEFFFNCVVSKIFEDYSFFSRFVPAADIWRMGIHKYH